jgi:hypothetical protein
VGLTLTARILWAAGFAENLVLLLVLLFRKRYRVFPVFTVLIGFNVLRTILLFLLYRYASPGTYEVAYWAASFIDLALQVGILFEMARIVLKPTGTWIRDAQNTFLLFGLLGAVAAAVIAYYIDPTFHNSLDFWTEKGSLFSVMLILELFAAMVFASTQLGLFGGNHVMRLAQGWAVWAVVDLISEGLYSHFGADWHGIDFDNIRILTYQVVTIFWIVTFWRSEPERRKLSPQMQSYLEGLHKQLNSTTRYKE